ncbi:hypothetical protein FSARC_2342 [Fusarium sarcochroum]|uniref:Uncharacterized protein n=1 Tax=Fusarium sarcochroum TaxID=1208366 RepID=A0A8H4XDZ0_9HYPO|nr:hypothetical protein FSARC_2342 [Fusarium sarcochroum]
MLTRNCTPPKSPPPGKPASWIWKCRRCSTTYKLSVTRRCLRCIETKMIGISHASTAKRRRRLRAISSIPAADGHDYDFWTAHNDWRRFRSVYEASPEAWRRRTMRDLAGTSGRERRIKKSQVETERRTEITQGRLERMLSLTHSCEQDCDYPSQCHTERYQAFLRDPSKVVGAVQPTATPDDSDNEEDQAKLPLCSLLPEFDQHMTSPEEIDDFDEILIAYESQEQFDDWFATSQLPSDDSDDDGIGSSGFDETVVEDD